MCKHSTFGGVFRLLESLRGLSSRPPKRPFLRPLLGSKRPPQRAPSTENIKHCGVQKWLRVRFCYLRDMYRNYFTGLGRLGNILGSALGRTDFSRIFIFEPPDFFADFVAGFFLLIFVGKSAQKNPPGKSPTKSSKFYTTKIPDNFLQRGQAKRLTVITLQDWVGWGTFTVIPGYPRRASSDSQHLEVRPELQDWPGSNYLP